MMTKLGLLATLWLGVLCATSKAPAWQDPGTLLKDVKKKGAAAVIQSLWGQPAWQRVTGSIGSGEEAWINVAVALSAGSDAGSTSELHDAMFFALSKNPAYLLHVLELVDKPPYRSFMLSTVCQGRVDPPSTYEEGITELERTRAAVEKVQVTELLTKKKVCLEKLREGEDHLKRIVGK